MYTMPEMVKQGGSSVYKTEPVYRKKRLKKGGGGTCILFNRW